MTGWKSLRFILPGLVCCAAISQACATTLTGSLSADDSVFTYNFSSTGTQLYNFYTTSYGGGTNADGTKTAAGGFDPILTLFSSSSGKVIGFGGGAGKCTGVLVADPTTHLCDDANFTALLTFGSYTLDLTEFPNAAVGKLSDGFLFSGSPTITGDVCGVRGGKFLESDVAPCVQRTSKFAVNVNPVAAATPEPSTFLMVFPALAALVGINRRRFAW